VEQDSVKINSNPAEIGAAQGEPRFEIVIRADAGKSLDRAQRITCQNAAQIRDVVTRE
jgi:hypothetical protein